MNGAIAICNSQFVICNLVICNLQPTCYNPLRAWNPTRPRIVYTHRERMYAWR